MCGCSNNAAPVGLLLMLMLMQSCTAQTAQHPHAHDSNPWIGNTTLTEYLVNISDWIMQTNVSSNVLVEKDGHKPASTLDAIFINGNLARVLLAAHKITNDERYLKEV